MSTIWPEISGYARDRGAPGLRNHVLAFSTVALTDVVTQRAAQAVPGVLPVLPRFERGLRGVDAERQARAIEAVVAHPNTGAALVVTHDRAAAADLSDRLGGLGKPVSVAALMAHHGVEAAIDAMTRDLARLTQAAGQVAKVPMSPADLTVALECGGSDASSAICANPAIGRFVDRLIAAGGTAIVSETAEFLGGERVVEAQSQTPEIAAAILASLAREDRLMKDTGVDYRGVNPTQENIEAGLTTLTEKTMGALSKIGRTRFAGALDFGETPPASGLYFMDTPFFSPTSLTGMALGGAQVGLFAVGVFNPSGMPLIPVMKICGNPVTLRDWAGSIDLDVSGLIAGAQGLDDAADDIAAGIARFADGAHSASERWGEGQLILPRETAAL